MVSNGEQYGGGRPSTFGAASEIALFFVSAVIVRKFHFPFCDPLCTLLFVQWCQSHALSVVPPTEQHGAPQIMRRGMET